MISVETKDCLQSETLKNITTLLEKDFKNSNLIYNKIYLLTYDIKENELSVTNQDIKNTVYLAKVINIDSKTLNKIKSGLFERFFNASNDLPFPLNINLTKEFFGNDDVIKSTRNNNSLDLLIKSYKEGIDITEAAKTYFNFMQIEQIIAGKKDNIDVSVYAKNEFKFAQMRRLRYSLRKGLDVSKYADPKYNHNQMRELSLGQESGVNIDLYLDSNFSDLEMREKRHTLEKNKKKWSFVFNAKDKLYSLFNKDKKIK